jgi:hypothetical protein
MAAEKTMLFKSIYSVVGLELYDLLFGVGLAHQ